MNERRLEEMLWCWENECSEDDEEWRDNLSAEEAALVETWDQGFDEGMKNIMKDIKDIRGTGEAIII